MLIDSILASVYGELKSDSQNILIKGPKILVVDSASINFLNQFVEQNQLLEDEFVLTTQINGLLSQNAYPNMEAVFYTAPTAENINFLVKILNKAQPFFQKVYLTFCSKITDNQLLELAEADVRGLVQSCKLIISNFKPIMSNFVISRNIDDFLLAYNVAPSAIRYESSSEEAKQIAFSIQKILEEFEYNNLGKSKTAKFDASKKPYQLVILERDEIMLTPTSFLGIADEVLHIFSQEKNFPYFLLSRIGRALSSINALQSDEERAKCAQTIKQELSGAQKAEKVEDISKILEIEQQQEEISNELMEFAMLEKDFGPYQKFFFEMSLNTQELLEEPTFDKAKEIIQIWQSSLAKENLLEEKTQILNYYAQQASEMLQICSEIDEKRQSKLKVLIKDFLVFLKQKSREQLNIEKHLSKMQESGKEDRLSMDYYMENAAANKNVIENQKIFAQLPKSDLEPYYVQQSEIIQNLASFAPRLLNIAESAVLNKFDQEFSFACNLEGGLAELTEKGEIIDVIFYIIGGISVDEVLQILEFEFMRGKQYEIERFLTSNCLFISDKIVRLNELE